MNHIYTPNSRTHCCLSSCMLQNQDRNITEADKKKTLQHAIHVQGHITLTSSPYLLKNTSYTCKLHWKSETLSGSHFTVEEVFVTSCLRLNIKPIDQQIKCVPTIYTQASKPCLSGINTQNTIMSVPGHTSMFAAVGHCKFLQHL